MSADQRAIVDAQLFWHRQDPENAGWTLRYYVFGGEFLESIDGDVDDGAEALAGRVAAALAIFDQEVTVRVFRGDEARGRVVVDYGRVVYWRSV